LSAYPVHAGKKPKMKIPPISAVTENECDNLAGDIGNYRP
jgi:hypothetical protein